MYTLDTNAVIYFLAGEKNVVSLITKFISEENYLYVPTMVRMELFSKPDLSLEDYASLSEFLRQVRGIDFDNRIADLAADIRRLYGVKVPDAIIAASAISMTSTLLTRNIPDFKMIKGLEIQAI